MKTKEKLAQRLHSIGLFDLEHMARGGEFSDFESDFATPKIELVNRLHLASNACRVMNPVSATRIFLLIKEVINGDWDDTREDAPPYG